MLMPIFKDKNGFELERRALLKEGFLERDQIQRRSKMEDLEIAVKINKEIINTLLDDQFSLDEKQSELFKKLTHENENLRERERRVAEERDEAQSKLLLSQQEVLAVDCKINDVCHEYEDYITELKEILDRKEYFIQNLEKKYGEYEDILKKISLKDETIKYKLKVIGNGVTPTKRISNIIEENDHLKMELVHAKKRIFQLASTANVEGDKENNLPLNAKNAKETPTKNPLRIDLRPTNQIDLPTALDLLQKLEKSLQYLGGKLKEKEDDCESLFEENYKLLRTNQKLFMANEQLTNALSQVNTRISKIRKDSLSTGIEGFNLNHTTFRNDGVGNSASIGLHNKSHSRSHNNSHANATTLKNSSGQEEEELIPLNKLIEDGIILKPVMVEREVQTSPKVLSPLFIENYSPATKALALKTFKSFASHISDIPSGDNSPFFNRELTSEGAGLGENEDAFPYLKVVPERMFR